MNNNNKKIDFILMNPPYATSSDNLHLKFADKCLDIADYQVTVMPISFIVKQNIKSQNVYKEKWDAKLTDIEEVDSKLFEGTTMPNCGIYVFGKESDYININHINQSNQIVKSLFDISRFNNYEDNIVNYFKNKKSVTVKNLGYFLPISHLIKNGITNKDEIKHEKYKNAIKCVKNIPDNKAYLICNSINGGMNGKFFTIKNGQILFKKDNLIQYISNIENVSNGYNCIILDSIEAAQNCKIALQNSVLRFLLYRIQQDQRMTAAKCYKYVPDINWEDPRVKTDEGLLEVCGCPKDKCKEYSDYCRKIIEEVDNKR